MNLSQIFNWPVAISGTLLVSIGTLVIFSSSPELALQQGFFALVGLIFFWFIGQFDYRSIRGLIRYFYFLVLILLLVVAFLGVETRGSVRWIPLGVFNIQPSEFAKPALILLLARFWETNLPTWKNIFKSLLVISPIVLLIFKQPDLGSALTLIAIWSGMLVAARISFKKILLLILIAVVAIPVGWISLHPYQKQRVVSFISPQSDPLGAGYNVIQSTIAVGSGQFFGRGLGQGTQSRLQFLPEFRTDFIFASIAEEMGFVGSIIILSIYFYLILYSIKVAEKSSDLFGFLITFGVVSMVLFQMFVNIGMNIGLLPITGITLPMISYGGSSLIATWLCLGLVASVAKFRKRIDTSTL